MKADAASLLAVFEKKMRLEIPLFQRQYVWSQEQQWEPLWDDISRKFSEYLAGSKDRPVHFLGAMVFDQKQTPTTHVERRQVIDGQQRLTTLQIFLAAFRDFCAEKGATDLSRECESYTLNRGMMAAPDVDKFKVWPTQLDRDQFVDVVSAGSRKALEDKHPLIKPKYARRFLPRPRMVEAYLFFYDRLSDYFKTEFPVADPATFPASLDECFQALKHALQVVVIDLGGDDDAQIIFETLNGRGEPLLPADLLRNFIFLRAAREGRPIEQLYDKYWKRFDDPFWRESVKQGRLTRPRSDLFMQHFLASQQGFEIPVKHLFVEYRFWLGRAKPFTDTEAEIGTLARFGDHFRRILEPKRGDEIERLVGFLDQFDVRTAYPLLLHLIERGLDAKDWAAIEQTIESYILRRAILGWTTQGYNRVFLGALKAAKESDYPPVAIRNHLGSLSGESSSWPSDEQFETAWLSKHMYQTLQHQKLVYLLKQLNITFLNVKSEEFRITSPLTVEHIMPQQWLQHWPLPDGSMGLTPDEVWKGDASDSVVQATRLRSAVVQTIGNLTLITQPLNSSISNSSWNLKKPALLQSSLLPINQQLHAIDHWDEKAIAQRSLDLFARAKSLWPRVTA